MIQDKSFNMNFTVHCMTLKDTAFYNPYSEKVNFL